MESYFNTEQDTAEFSVFMKTENMQDFNLWIMQQFVNRDSTKLDPQSCDRQHYVD